MATKKKSLSPTVSKLLGITSRSLFITEHKEPIVTLRTNHERVIQILTEQLGLEPGTVTPEKRLQEDLGCDSLDEVELVMAIEDEFGLEIPDEDVQGQMPTVQDVLNYVDKKLAAQDRG